MQLRTPGGQILTYCVLQMFPFTSEGKRMGIIVRVGRRARPTIIDTAKGVTSDSSLETTEAELVNGHFLVLFCFQQQEHAEDFKVRMIYNHKVAAKHPH